MQISLGRREAFSVYVYPCQWLLNHIGETHKTQEILKAIEIAQPEGYISKAGHLTVAGKSYIEQNREVFSLVE